jgi:type VI protein secretion system component VasK
LYVVIIKKLLTMNALMENKLVAGTIIAVVLLVGLWGVWKGLNGTAPAKVSNTVVDLKSMRQIGKRVQLAPQLPLLNIVIFNVQLARHINL